MDINPSQEEISLGHLYAWISKRADYLRKTKTAESAGLDSSTDSTATKPINQIADRRVNSTPRRVGIKTSEVKNANIP